ncbi:MAG: hypothetical protein KC502_14775 [Myxococcales bacterium]|nr:hypothetical protein [Myxococcales bacterium]
MSHDQEDLFWRLAAPHIRSGAAVEGTMMGSRCLRTNGQFVAMVHSKTLEIIVKLPADRVVGLIGQDVAAEFRPNGRLFKEWALLPTADESELRDLLIEAIAFANQPKPTKHARKTKKRTQGASA